MSEVFPIAPDTRFRISTALGGETSFSISFPFQDDADISIVKIASDNTETLLSYPVDYTITGAGSPTGGTVNLSVAAVAGEKYLRVGAAILNRVTSIVRSSRFSSAAIDNDLDRWIIIAQELARDVGRSIKVEYGGAPFSVFGGGTEGEMLAFDGAGNLVPVSALGFVEKGPWSVSTSYIKNDLVEYGGSQWMARRTNLGAIPIAGDDWFLFLAGTVSQTDGLTHVTQFGAKGDGLAGADGVMLIGDADFTSASASFVVGDVGKTISVDGAGVGGVTLVTTIFGYNGVNSVTLSVAASTAVAAAKYSYGTDNSAAFQAAFDQGGGVYVPVAAGPYMIKTVTITRDTLLCGAGAASTVKQFFDNSSISMFRADVNALKFDVQNIKIDGASEDGTPIDNQGTSMFMFNINAWGNPAIDGHGLADDALRVSFNNVILANPVGNGIYFYGSDTYDTEELLSVKDCLFQGGADSVNSALGRVYIKASNAANMNVIGNQFIGKQNVGGDVIEAFHGFTAINTTANGASFRDTLGSYIFANNRMKYCGNLKDNVVESYSHSRDLIITGNLIEECNAVGGIRCKSGTQIANISNNIIRHARRADGNSNGIVLAGASTSGHPGAGQQISICNNSIFDVMVGIVVVGDSPYHSDKFKNVVISNNNVAAWGDVGLSVDAVDNCVITGNSFDNSYHNVADYPIAAVGWVPATEDVVLTAHPYKDQQGPFRLTTTGTFPAGLNGTTDYYVRPRVGGVNTFQLSLTRTGPILEFSTSGVGSHTLTPRRAGAIQLQDMDGQVIVSGNNITGLAGDGYGIIGASSGALESSSAELVCNGNAIETAKLFCIYCRFWKSITITNNRLRGLAGIVGYGDTTALSLIDGNTFLTGGTALADYLTNTDMRIGVNFS